MVYSVNGTAIRSHEIELCASGLTSGLPRVLAGLSGAGLLSVPRSTAIHTLCKAHVEGSGTAGTEKENQVPFLRSGSSSIGGGNTRQSMPRAFPGQIGPA
jgi:hypothetical protein